MNPPNEQPTRDYMTCSEIAKLQGVHKSRIQFIEKRALRKMRLAAEREAESAGMSVRDWLLGEIE